MAQSKQLPRREREKLRQRQDMLAAALELFSEKGYHSVSMNEIAEKAEFAVGTLYKFFQNKEDLYKSIIAEQADKFHQAINKALQEGKNEIEKLRNYVQVKGEIFMDNVAVVRLYFAETSGASFSIRVGFDADLRKKHDQVMDKITAIFARGIKRKVFNKIAEPRHLTFALDGITSAFLFSWLEEPERHPYPENPDVILNVLFKGLINS